MHVQTFNDCSLVLNDKQVAACAGGAAAGWQRPSKRRGGSAAQKLQQGQQSSMPPAMLTVLLQLSWWRPLSSRRHSCIQGSSTHCVVLTHQYVWARQVLHMTCRTNPTLSGQQQQPQHPQALSRRQTAAIVQAGAAAVTGATVA